ncbi:MAG: hypothetical protein HUJ56_01810, partial [Erysipelotrichaceae bacterium]|nr:hypothetical protein [Erysipelotrichaceae bacterium]
TTWKYYVEDGLLNFSWGLKTALNPLQQIDKVTIDFYDWQGHIGTYTAEDYETYNGVFSDYIGLNAANANTLFTPTRDNHYHTTVNSLAPTGFASIFTQPLYLSYKPATSRQVEVVYRLSESIWSYYPHKMTKPLMNYGTWDTTNLKQFNLNPGIDYISPEELLYLYYF